MQMNLLTEKLDWSTLLFVRFSISNKLFSFVVFFLLQEKDIDKRRLSKEILKIIVIFHTLYIFLYFLQFVRKLEDAEMRTIQKYMKFPECSICSDIGKAK